MESTSPLKSRYNQFKHHAWAGLGALSLFFAATRFFSVPDTLAAVITTILTIYAGTALVLTYRYRKEFYLKEVDTLEGKEKEKLEKKKAKNEEKIQKKKLKAELKAQKKLE